MKYKYHLSFHMTWVSSVLSNVQKRAQIEAWSFMTLGVTDDYVNDP